MVKPDAPEAQGQAVPIRIVTGDDWLGGRAVHAIKIDTAGSEVDVLRGLKRTIQMQRPPILIDHGSGALERIQRLAGEIGMKVAATVPSSRQRRDSSLLMPA